jgi:hypothetical protein
MNGLPVFIGSRVFEFNGPFTVWAYRELRIWIIGHHVVRTKKVIIYSHGPLSLPSRAKDIPQPLYGCLLIINNWSCNVGSCNGNRRDAGTSHLVQYFRV